MSSEAGAWVCQLDGVSKRYLLGQGRGARGVLLGLAGFGHQPDRTRWALRDVSLQLRRGQSVGLVGRNGAGKTTLLRLLAGITRPTLGAVTTRGRVASLLNLGAGFHPELTGRENIYLNGVILGLSRDEVRRRFDAIVDFSELGAYLETPVKRYSSGMYARLAFSVAVHTQPDLLLVDEVLSVGDAAFQDRSLRRMQEIRDRGETAIVFVSHNLAAIELMCDQALWLDAGRVCARGETSGVLRAYLDAVDEADSGLGEAALSADCVEVLDQFGRPSDCLDGDAPFTVRVVGRAHRELVEPVFVVTIRGDHGPLFAGNMHIDGNWPAALPAGPFSVDCCFAAPGLRPGSYRVELKVKQNVRTNYFEPRIMARFRVPGPPGPGGGAVPYTIIGGQGART